MLRVVIDANVLVSALLSRRGAPALVLKAWKDRQFVLVTSESAIRELRRVLWELYASGKYTLTKKQIFQLIRFLRSDGIRVVNGEQAKGVIPQDPDDEKFLSIAVTGNAQVIISGDKHLLNLGKYQNTLILSARQFLDSNAFE